VADPSASAVPLIPREILFDNPDRAMARISPDGRHISWLAPVDGVLNVWVAPAADLESAQPVTNDTVRGIRSYAWPYSEGHLLYVQDVGGDENWHVHRVDLHTDDAGKVVGRQTTDLTPFDGARAEISGISPDRPHEILVGMNDRDPQLHDLYRIDLRTGERTLVLENEGFLAFVTDHDYQVRYGARMNPDGSTDYLKRVDGEWRPFAHIDPEDDLTTQARGINRSGDTLFMVDSRRRDTAALVAVHTETDDSLVLADDDRADAGGVLVHPVTGEPQAVSFTYARTEWTILDKSIADDLAYLATVADGEVDVIDRTLDDRTWIVAYLMDNGPVRYYRYDRSDAATDRSPGDGERPGTATYLFSSRSALDEVELTRMHSTVVTAGDGLDMVTYYSLPSWIDDAADHGEPPTPPAPLPTVLLVHGGPWGRDDWGYNPFHQMLANRGYAVVSVNFRGSTGFGKSFINAANGEWGRRMHDDLLDTVDWAVKAGIADRGRVAIMGGSYGGYATLAGLTFTPEVFACGVDIVGPSNLNTLIESVPEYWKPMVEMLHTRVGDPNTPEGAALLAERSPLTHADRIRRPLLIGQGANDPRVKQAESDQIVAAMQSKGIPVTYVLYPDEGHGFARPENMLSFMAVTEVFLAQHLHNDRYQPLPGDFAGSSIEVVTGADGIPGLSTGSLHG
jgi:dipeptidyl aminopeptidase/acylaminoacyl peptidase